MSEKYTLMQAEKARYPIARMARLLKVWTACRFSDTPKHLVSGHLT